MNPYYVKVFDVTPGNKVLSQGIEDEFTRVSTGFDGVQTAIAAAASYGAAPAWVTGTTYAQGFVVYSTVNGALYRRITAGAGTTDPSSDPTNWVVVIIGLTRVDVSTTTKVASPGYDFWLENVALTAVTAPSAVDGARFAVTPANGLKTNTIDFGAATVRGPNGTATGVITIDLGARMEFIYSSVVGQWVML